MLTIKNTTEINHEVLEFYIYYTERKCNKVFTDYKELANKINLFFKKNYTARDIWLHYEPTIAEEELDKRIHYEVIM